MSVTEWLAVIGAVTVAVTTVISAIGTVIVTIRSSHIQATVNETKILANGHTDSLAHIAQEQATALTAQATTIKEAGLTPPSTVEHE